MEEIQTSMSDTKIIQIGDEAIDLGYVYRVYMFEENKQFKLCLMPTYGEPLIKEFDSRAKAKLEYNRVLMEWKKLEGSNAATTS